MTMSAVAEGMLIDLSSPCTAPVTPNLRRKKSFSSPQLLTFDDSDSELSLASPMSDDERPRRNRNRSFDFDDPRSWVKFQVEAKQVSIQLELTSTPAAMRRLSVSQKPASVVKKLDKSPVPPASANKENGCLFNRLESLERRLNNLKKDYSFQEDPQSALPRSPLAPKNRCLEPSFPSSLIPPQFKPSLLFPSKPNLMQKPAIVPMKAATGPLKVTRPAAESASPALCRAAPPPSPMRPATPSRLPRLSLSKFPAFRSVPPPPSPQTRPAPPKVMTTPGRCSAIPRLASTPGRSLLPKPTFK